MASVKRRPYGVLGVFVVLLGAGLVLDGDRLYAGPLLMAVGGLCLFAEWRQPVAPDPP
jgi:hypothetical protein